MPFPKKAELTQINSETMESFSSYLTDIIEEYSALPGNSAVKAAGGSLLALHSFTRTLSQTGRAMTQDEINELLDKTNKAYSDLFDLISKDQDEHFLPPEQFENWFDVSSHLLNNLNEISAVRLSFNDQNTSELTGHKMDLLLQSNPTAQNIFTGENTTAPTESDALLAKENKALKHRAVDAALIILAGKGYPLDEIMDPAKLSDEKQKTFSEVTALLRSSSSGSRSKLAQLLYDGMNASIKLIDDTVSEIDFETETAYNSKRLSQLMFFVKSVGKANDMMKSCGDEVEAYAREKGNDLPDIDDICSSNDEKLGYMSLLSEYYLKSLKTASDLANYYDPDDNCIKSAMIEQHIIRGLHKKIAACKKASDSPHSAWLLYDERSELSTDYSNWKSAMLSSSLSFEDRTDKQKKDIAKLIFTKGYPSDLKINTTGRGLNKKTAVTNIPKLIQIDAETAMNKAASQSARIKALRVQTHKAYKAVWHSSSEYNKACDALEELRQAYEKYDELDELNAATAQRRKALGLIQRKCRKAEYRITRYFDRKLEQSQNGAVFKDKTVDRIRIMMTAAEEIRSCKQKADIAALENEQGIKRLASERSQAAVKKLEKLAEKNKAETLPQEELIQARKYMSTVLAADKILDMPSPGQLPGQDDESRLKTAANGVLSDAPFIRATNAASGRDISKFLYSRKDLSAGLTCFRTLIPNAPQNQAVKPGSKKPKAHAL